MKTVELRLIAELMKNSRRSDRELAKTIGVSQPTITRTRIRLEREGLIEYTAVPNFAKLGFDILAFSLIKRDIVRYPYNPQKAKDFIGRKPQFIFAAGGMGVGFDRIVVTVHKNYPEYTQFMQDVRTDWMGFITLDNFVVDLKSESIVQPLSFKHFAEYLLMETTSMRTAEKNQKRYPLKKEKEKEEDESEKEQK